MPAYARNAAWVPLDTAPVPTRDRNPDVPGPLADLLDVALNDRDRLRFASAAEFRAALRAADAGARPATGVR